jgi:DNA-binding NarL/FixJ family response regulator
MTINVAIVDDHPLVVGGLDTAPRSTPDIRVVARGGMVEEGRSILSRTEPRRWRSGRGDTCSRPHQELVATIRRVAAGGSAFTEEQLLTAQRSARLTPQDREIVRHLVAGRSNTEIARLIGVSSKVVEAHPTTPHERLGSHPGSSWPFPPSATAGWTSPHHRIVGEPRVLPATTGARRALPCGR